MSRFYASIQGNRGEATRQGTPRSGIAGHIRGWAIGGRIDVDAQGDTDIVTFCLTGGSTNGSASLGLCPIQFRRNPEDTERIEWRQAGSDEWKPIESF